MRIKVVPGMWYVLSLLLATVVSGSLLIGDALLYHDLVPVYLLWNLFLAWVPFMLTLWLLRTLRHKAWSSWEGMLVSVAWLAFLPNSFYMVTDFIHLSEVSSPDQLLFSTLLFTSFIYTGVLLGLSSLYIVHIELRKRLPARIVTFLIGAVLLVCSIAIYIGRDLRWNTWDLLLDPAGVLFDISSRLLHPAQYGSMLTVVVPFFMLLVSVYIVAWQGRRLFYSGRPYSHSMRQHRRNVRVVRV